MLGCVIHGRGDLRVDELPVPEPGPGQALVAVRFGGVCGSDLHYWRHGGVGDFRLREPMLLGHEVVGTVSPTARRRRARPSGAPSRCIRPRPAECVRSARRPRERVPDTRHLGSAARFPHVQGGFAARVAVPPPS
ncbi:hypothetical protein E4K10_09075 [Streptomyces sp. T1317-0309]|nr:hypothetical protein E4K10_09075 [Streptomyces sp. T1317-0309]